MANDLATKLTPTHLHAAADKDINEAEELKRRLEEKEAEREQPKQDPEQLKMMEREYTFTFRHEEGGRVLEGEFTNSILSLKQKRKRGILRAQLCGALPFESLDPLTSEQAYIIAHLTHSLVKRPEWANDLESLDVDYSMLQNLYEKVAAHERTFRGRNAAQAKGA